MESMGNQTAHPEKRPIIDFLYRDFSKINSFYAQIFQGNLISVTKFQENTKTGSYQLTGGLSSLIQGATSRQEHTQQSIAEQFEPHDAKALSLLRELAINVYEGSLKDTQTGQIVLLKGQLTIRNYQTIKSALPHLLEAGFLNDNINVNQGNKAKKQYRREIHAFSKLLGLIPGGFELEICTLNNELAIGPINPDYLTVNPDDLLRLYGNFIPGEWFVMGIISHAPNIHISSFNDFRKSLDFFAMAISELYSAETPYTIFPILVFRELQYL